MNHIQAAALSVSSKNCETTKQQQSEVEEQANIDVHVDTSEHDLTARSADDEIEVKTRTVLMQPL